MHSHPAPESGRLAGRATAPGARLHARPRRGTRRSTQSSSPACVKRGLATLHLSVHRLEVVQSLFRKAFRTIMCWVVVSRALLTSLTALSRLATGSGLGKARDDNAFYCQVRALSDGDGGGASRAVRSHRAAAARPQGWTTRSPGRCSNPPAAGMADSNSSGDSSGCASSPSCRQQNRGQACSSGARVGPQAGRAAAESAAARLVLALLGTRRVENLFAEARVPAVVAVGEQRALLLPGARGRPASNAGDGGRVRRPPATLAALEVRARYAASCSKFAA